MKLFCVSHTFRYEFEKLLNLFFPLEKTEVLYEYSECEDDYLYSEVIKKDGSILLVSRLHIGEKESENKKALPLCREDDTERELAVLCFELLCSACGFTPKWGILTGVRPSKLMIKCIESDGEEDAKRYFKEKLLVSEQKTELACTVAKAEEKIISISGDRSFSLYISIPFCPTRCSYCSFVSHSISSPSAKKLIPDYTLKLCEEIKETAKYAKENSLVLRSCYWGGGTPTTLSAEELDTVLTVIENSFDFSQCLEYTVEAGRPDTITKEKLITLKKHNVSRISINPQTFNDDVLKAIGRNHTVSDTTEKFRLARELGFDCINTDLIAGLPSDTLESFCNSIDKAVELNPENITVHTLALKRSSSIVTGNSGKNLDKNVTALMVDYAYNALYKAGYKPYYMYRQSKSLGNLENVGWCKEGKECLYNVFMMEECHSILSSGAGAVTKLVSKDCSYIERIFNYKYPFEYIERFNTLSERKSRITSFCREYM